MRKSVILARRTTTSPSTSLHGPASANNLAQPPAASVAATHSASRAQSYAAGSQVHACAAPSPAAGPQSPEGMAVQSCAAPCAAPSTPASTSGTSVSGAGMSVGSSSGGSPATVDACEADDKARDEASGSDVVVHHPNAALCAELKPTLETLAAHLKSAVEGVIKQRGTNVSIPTIVELPPLTEHAGANRAYALPYLMGYGGSDLGTQLYRAGATEAWGKGKRGWLSDASALELMVAVARSAAPHLVARASAGARVCFLPVLHHNATAPTAGTLPYEAAKAMASHTSSLFAPHVLTQRPRDPVAAVVKPGTGKPDYDVRKRMLHETVFMTQPPSAESSFFYVVVDDLGGSGATQDEYARAIKAAHHTDCKVEIYGFDLFYCVQIETLRNQPTLPYATETLLLRLLDALFTDAANKAKIISFIVYLFGTRLKAYGLKAYAGSCWRTGNFLKRALEVERGGAHRRSMRSPGGHDSYKVRELYVKLKRAAMREPELPLTAMLYGQSMPCEGSFLALWRIYALEQCAIDFLFERKVELNVARVAGGKTHEEMMGRQDYLRKHGAGEELTEAEKEQLKKFRARENPNANFSDERRAERDAQASAASNAVNGLAGVFGAPPASVVTKGGKPKKRKSTS